MKQMSFSEQQRFLRIRSNEDTAFYEDFFEIDINNIANQSEVFNREYFTVNGIWNISDRYNYVEDDFIIHRGVAHSYSNSFSHLDLLKIKKESLDIHILKHSSGRFSMKSIKDLDINAINSRRLGKIIKNTELDRDIFVRREYLQKVNNLIATNNTTEPIIDVSSIDITKILINEAILNDLKSNIIGKLILELFESDEEILFPEKYKKILEIEPYSCPSDLQVEVLHKWMYLIPETQYLDEIQIKEYLINTYNISPGSARIWRKVRNKIAHPTREDLTQETVENVLDEMNNAVTGQTKQYSCPSDLQVELLRKWEIMDQAINAHTQRDTLEILINAYNLPQNSVRLWREVRNKIAHPTREDLTQETVEIVLNEMHEVIELVENRMLQII